MADPKGRVQFDELYAQVNALLGQGAFRPGDRIGIKDVAALLGASTTPTREILSRLVGRGLVEERRSEGYYLRLLDERQIADLYDLHARCIDLALQNRAASANDAIAPGGADVWAMFDSLVDATGNIALLDTRRALHARLALITRCEIRLFENLAAETDHMRASLRSDDRATRRKAVRAFHQRRIRHARQLAFCLGRE
jgi:DNA-binding GntR family transcriptional regulator